MEIDDSLASLEGVNGQTYEDYCCSLEEIRRNPEIGTLKASSESPVRCLMRPISGGRWLGTIYWPVHEAETIWIIGARICGNSMWHFQEFRDALLSQMREIERRVGITILREFVEEADAEGLVG